MSSYKPVKRRVGFLSFFLGIVMMLAAIGWLAGQPSSLQAQQGRQGEEHHAAKATAQPGLPDAIPAPGQDAVAGIDQNAALPPGPPARKARKKTAAGFGSANRGLRIYKEKAGLKLRGKVPCEDDQKAILGMVKASFPGLPVSDRTKIHPEVSGHDVWLGGVSFALRQLAWLRHGAAVLQDNRLYLHGAAATPEGYDAVQRALQFELPKGLELKGSYIRPPSRNQYTWLAQFKEGNLALSGHVPGQGAHQALEAMAKVLFSGILVVNAMEITGGAPQDWLEAARQSLRALSWLQSGSVMLSDKMVKIDGVTSDDAVVTYIAPLDQTLLKGFALEDGLKLSKQTGGPSLAAPQPE